MCSTVVLIYRHIFVGETLPEPPYATLVKDKTGRIKYIHGIVGDIWHSHMEVLIYKYMFNPQEAFWDKIYLRFAEIRVLNIGHLVENLD